ncbi:MAG: G5 domain-containing protein [Eubacterium sp.]|nr:G5 domain-containing protein [Eubacterium sp.]
MNKQSKAANKLGIKKLAAAAVIALIITAIFTSTAFADSLGKYDVTVVDGGVESTIATAAKEPIDVLNTAGIKLDSDDKMDITAFEKGKGGKIVISRHNAVNVKFSGNIQTYEVYSSTVGEALDEIGLTVGEEKNVNYDFGDIVKDGMVIDIKSAPSVTLNADGKSVKLAKVVGTVSDLIKLAGYELDEDDYIEPSLDTELKADMTVNLYKVSYETVEVDEEIAYNTVKQDDKKLDQGKTEVVTKGENGSKKVTYEIKTVNGKEEAKTVKAEVITKAAVDEVVKVGTKFSEPGVKPNGVTSKNGLKLGQKISGRYTHYCACAACNGSGSGTTTSGRKIHNGMKDPHYIACNWLPMGSVVKVNGVCYTVVDRGGSGLSRRGRIDIFTPQGHSACYRLGSGSCTVQIVRLGW